MDAQRDHSAVIAAVVVFVIFALGYAFGRYAAPDKVVEKTDTQAQERVRELTQQLETMQRHTTRETVVTFTPTGKPLSKTVREDTHVDKSVGTRTEAEAVRVEHVVTEKLVERTRPDWRIDPVLGVDLRSGVVIYGAMVERRILGPVSVGLWGLSSGVVGVALTVEF